MINNYLQEIQKEFCVVQEEAEGRINGHTSMYLEAELI